MGLHHNLSLKFRKKPYNKKEIKKGEVVFFNRVGWAKIKIEFDIPELRGLYIFVIDKEIWKGIPVTMIGMTTKTYNKIVNSFPLYMQNQNFDSFLGIPIHIRKEHVFPVRNKLEGIWTNLCCWR